MARIGGVWARQKRYRSKSMINSSVVVALKAKKGTFVVMRGEA